MAPIAWIAVVLGCLTGAVRSEICKLDVCEYHFGLLVVHLYPAHTSDVSEQLVMGYGQFLVYPRNGTLYYIDFNGVEQRVPENDAPSAFSS